jgi:YD repeat-containing protein
MKNLISITIATCLFLFTFTGVFGQGADTKIKKNSLSELMLKGNVKTVTENIFEEKDENRQFIKNKQTKRIILFNEKGNITEETSFNSKGKIDSKRVYTYDANENLILQDFFIYDQAEKKLVMLGKYGYKYDDRGNKTEEGNYTTDGTDLYSITSKRIFDEKGNRIAIINYFHSYSGAKNDSSKTTYIYDELGNCIEEFTNSNSFHSKTFKYDEKGNNIETTTFNKDGSLKSTETSRYNIDNNVVEFYSGLGKRYTYFYDEKGNKTEETVYNPDGSLAYAFCYKWVYDYDTIGSCNKITQYEYSTLLKKMIIREIIYK